MGKFVFLLKIFESSFKVLFAGFQALPWRVLFADPLDGLIQFLLNLLDGFFRLFKVPACPYKVDKQQDDSAVMMVTGISRYLRYLFVFLRIEVVL